MNVVRKPPFGGGLLAWKSAKPKTSVGELTDFRKISTSCFAPAG
jgi:hypothetical protein